MKKLAYILLGLSLILACTRKNTDTEDRLYEKQYPYLDRYIEYNYPNISVDIEAYTMAIKSANEDANQKNKSILGFEQEWKVQGPGNIGARVNTLAVNPENHDEIYAGFSGGGLFKTTDGGKNWSPIFEQNSFLSIGHITIDPKNTENIYVGTGDPNLSGFPNIGNGVFKSVNGGEDWKYLGLEEQRIISKVELHPTQPNTIFAATMGLPFTKNNTRGIYRTLDGGENWDQVLFVSDSTGFTDIIINPENPDIIYASSWDRVRSNSQSIVFGEGSNMYMSNDGGENWNRVGAGLPDGVIGRHGMEICTNHPNNVYVIVVNSAHGIEGIYHSQDYGASFERVDTEGLPNNVLGGFGWYFGKIHVNPNDPNHFYVLGVEMWETRDAGQTWSLSVPEWWTYEVHADKHDLRIMENGNLYLATDGGVYQSHIDSTSWRDIENIPTTQFYRTAYNPHRPDLYYGGAQDNGTTGGNVDDIDNWPRLYGGDGFQMVFNPLDPEHYFYETQRGNIVVSTQGYFSDATEGLEGPRDWDMQYIMSPHDPSIMYTGTNRVYRCSDSYNPFWVAISDTLTENGLVANRPANITTLDESPVRQGVLYTGTNNSLVHCSKDGGQTWTKVSNDLPTRYVTDVKASPSFESWAYVSFSGYKDNDFSPRLYLTKDFGQTWESIVSNLPDIAINDVFIIPNTEDKIIFVATDGGVYGTVDAGGSWERVGANMPSIKVYDLAYNVEKKELVAATFARSIQSYDIQGILDLLSTTDDLYTDDIRLFPNPVKDHLFLLGLKPNKAYQISIFSSQGQIIRQESFNHKYLDVSNLETGLYIIVITEGSTKRQVTFVKA